MSKYIAVVKSIAVRDVQICASEDTELLEGNWQDFPGAEVFLGTYEGPEAVVLSTVAENWDIAESNIRLIKI